MANSVRYTLNKTKYLNPPEADRLTHILDTYIDENPRDIMMIYLALKTGARATEILNLKAEDLNSYDQTVFIKGIKNSNDREIPIQHKLFRRLESLPQAEDGSLFPICYHRLRQIWELYRPCHKKFHGLRHTFAINLYKKTKDIRLVQVALGHRNITNTMIYAEYVYSTQELKKAIL